MRCPRCGSIEDTEQVDDENDWWWCDRPACRFVFRPEQPPRLVDPPPTDEQRRRDLE